eukprot:g1257.t1
MVKHNNIVPNGHFRKDWQRFVRTWLDQPASKKRRRQKRAAKAQAIAPRPVAGLLRPVVRCPTNKYNTRTRVGRGFTVSELKEAGINPKEARQIGICVDKRRRNTSVESFQANVERLKAYKGRLIVFPRRRGKIKNGDSKKADLAVATQLKGPLMPVKTAKTLDTVEFADVAEVKDNEAYKTLRAEWTKARYFGKRNKAKDE